ncbi:MAG: insulinase family protein [Candidatus Harrisonbacteria bacterium]|nr:insulinase family protein [Candidatus Harrisonbacteria bacterium]
MSLGFKKITLPNGLRIVLVPEADSLTTTVLVLVATGSKYETKDINGISHFLEHMCFKGTTRRPHAIDISSELDGIGAEYNAFTSQEWTGYFAKAQPKHTERILDVVSDIYLNQKLDEKEIEKEKGVVIEELNMYEDTPPRKVQDLFMDLLYGDQPAGWDIGGTKEIVNKLTRQKLTDYRAAQYVAQATIIVVAGKFDPSGIAKSIKRHFTGINTGKKMGKLKTKESQQKPAILLRHKESDQAHIVMGVRAFDAYDKRRYALNVLADVLGGGMSSRLFQKVRGELGAAYSIRADADLFTDHGFFAVSAGVNHEKLDIAIKATLDELSKIAGGDLSAGDLQRAKDHLSGRFLLGLESSDAMANFYGGQEILGEKLKTPDEIVKAVGKVSRNEVIKLAKDIFRNDKLNLAIIGPYKDKKRFEKLLSL